MKKILPSIVTKRAIAKSSPLLFDPCGILQPFTVRGKMILRELWSRRLSWDEPIDDDLREIWEIWINDLDFIETLMIERSYCMKQVLNSQVFGFRDASNNCYATAMYLKSQLIDSTVEVSLVASKSKICPLKQENLIIPKKELLAAVLTARLTTFVRDSLSMFGMTIRGCFSDSQIVLCWIKGSEEKLGQFVLNRVREIQSLIPKDDGSMSSRKKIRRICQAVESRQNN